ncbi:hypothetical protein BTVI_18438 [Pitangus sulphuratus]|nr:hypothetical protein BTVI_18438 [Pitangus sulphuratus]
MLEKARQQLQEEILRVQSQLLDEKKRREHQEALVRRLQRRVVLLTKEDKAFALFAVLPLKRSRGKAGNVLHQAMAKNLLFRQGKF